MSTLSSESTTEVGPRFDWRILLRQLAPLTGLVLVFALFSILRPRTFLTPFNVQVILMQTAVVGIAALGMTLIIISGGIDLSVGSTVALGTILIALLLRAGYSAIVAAAAGVAGAVVIGALIGVLVTGLRLRPFIVTLGMLAAVRGLALQMAGNKTVVPRRGTWLNELLNLPSRERMFTSVAPGVWILLALALLTSGILRYTRFGRHVFAIGSNEQTARLCGVNVALTKLLIYTVAGLLFGVAAVLQFSYLTLGDPTTAGGFELAVIAAVVIGGASLSGGEGTVLGTMVGALLMVVVANGCTKLGFENSVQLMVTGVIIILAVALDQLRHRRDAA